MFKHMTDDKNEKFWLAFHVLMGVVLAYFKWSLLLFFYALLISSFIQLLKNQNKDFVLFHVLVYTLGIEQLNRSIDLTPYVPYEVGKYMTATVVLFGLLYPATSNKKVQIGTYFLLLTLPAFFILPAEFRYRDIVFNYLGVFCIGIAVTFFSKQELNYTDLRKLFKSLIFPIITFTCYIMLKQQQAGNVEYGLAANYETSGGSATNQVSTILGFAFAIMGLMYLTNQKLFKTKYVDLIITIAFLFRALLTFSRGGIISGVLALILVLIISKNKSAWSNRQVVFRKINPVYYIYGLVFMIASFLIVNSITGNFLLLRYQGYNQHTLRTGKRDINSFTSNRSEIMASDIAIFADNPLFGVGIGQSKYWRKKYGFKSEALPHSEPTRLLAEHGLFGVVLLFILIFYPIYKIRNEENNYRKAFMTVCFSIAVLSSFHSAMRTMITPLAFGMACLNIVPDAPFRTVSRNKPVIAKKEQSLLATA